eukprot:jgi/Astpho2/5614/e_gw1.00079.242.1_t
MPTDPQQAAEFAQSKGQARKEGRTGVTFDDVAGLEPIVTELQRVVEFLKDPKNKSLGGRPPKGVLLEGGPGLGKTLIAKAIAGEADVPFFEMSGSEFVEAIVGVGAARIRDLFKRARVQKSACIIFVDEIDAVGLARARAGVQTNEEREQTLNQLLTEMDGFVPGSGVVFVAATNRADLLDPALVRPGRFDRVIRVRPPNTEARCDILKVHARRRKLDPDVDLLQIAKDLPGLPCLNAAGAELANVMNEAAVQAIRRDAESISQQDILDGIERILQGVPHPGLPRHLEVRRVLAVHEAGSGIVAAVLRQRTGRLEAVEKMSLKARTSGLSRTDFARGTDEAYTMVTRGMMRERIQAVMAGRAAEEIVFGCSTSYSMQDLEDATRLARNMVTMYGLSDLGITTWAPVPEPVSAENQRSQVRAAAALCEVSVQGCMGMTAILESCRGALDRTVDLLLEKEVLTGEQLTEILNLHPPMPQQRPPPDSEVRLPAKLHPMACAVPSLSMPCV